MKVIFSATSVRLTLFLMSKEALARFYLLADHTAECALFPFEFMLFEQRLELLVIPIATLFTVIFLCSTMPGAPESDEGI